MGGLRKKLVLWLGREFVVLSCEGVGPGTASDQMEDIYDRVTAELQSEGLTLDQSVRTRLWGVDRQSRDMGSEVRAKYNQGQARAATSSYIVPTHFASDAARVGLDVVALRPASTGTKKVIVESVPPRRPLSYLVLDSLLVLSGKTVVLPSLEEQLAEILPRIADILQEAGSTWDRVVQLSFYLHRSQTSRNLRDVFSGLVSAPMARMEIVAVDGYSAEGKLVEVEVTAERARQR